MDVCARLVLSGKKLDSLRRRRSWLGFFWPCGFRSLSNVKRWSGSWPGGEGGGGLIRDRGWKTTPHHPPPPHTHRSTSLTVTTSLTGHTVFTPTCLYSSKYQSVLVTESDKATDSGPTAGRKEGDGFRSMFVLACISISTDGYDLFLFIRSRALLYMHT